MSKLSFIQRVPAWLRLALSRLGKAQKVDFPLRGASSQALLLPVIKSRQVAYPSPIFKLWNSERRGQALLGLSRVVKKQGESKPIISAKTFGKNLLHDRRAVKIFASG